MQYTFLGRLANQFDLLISTVPIACRCSRYRFVIDMASLKT